MLKGFNILGGRSVVPLDASALSNVQRWVRQSFDLTADDGVMVTELKCAEDGCAPIETVINILKEGGGRQQFKIFKPLADVTPDDVLRLKNSEEEGHEGHSHE